MRGSCLTCTLILGLVRSIDGVVTEYSVIKYSIQFFAFSDMPCFFRGGISSVVKQIEDKVSQCICAVWDGARRLVQSHWRGTFAPTSAVMGYIAGYGCVF